MQRIIERKIPTYQKFTDKILSLIDQITNEDWEQGWEKGKHIINTAPESIKERKYTGINTFALMLSQIANRYEVPVFMTFNQAKELGVQILPNSKGIPLMKAKVVLITGIKKNPQGFLLPIMRRCRKRKRRML